jgi:cobalt/nickel transport system permease protein
MKHSFLDQYSNLDSFLHRLDPRVKFITTLAFILAVVVTPPLHWWAFIGYLILLVCLLLLSKLPTLYVLKRSLVIVPFVLMIAIFIPFFKQGEVAGSYNIWLWQVTVTYDGLAILANVLIKAWLSILSLILLSSTTEFTSLLKGLEQLRMPRAMLIILSFVYRYIFVIVDEAMRLRQARDSRNFGRGKLIWQIKTVGNMIGTLFIRSYERGERVYSAMVSRGYDGRIRMLGSLRFRQADAYFSITFLLALVSISLVTFLWQV